MAANLTQEELVEIADSLAEYTAGYAGFLSWARGEIEPEETDELEDQPWRASFILFAGRGRVEVYRKILEEHDYKIDEYNAKFLEATDAEVEEWLKDTYNQTARHLEEAAEFLIEAYRRGYKTKGNGKLGWDFDDFLEERDILEFFLIGVGDRFPTTDFSMTLFNLDCEIREHIAELGLENYAEEYFPDRIPWFPQRFWWHHRPEDRIQHPDSLET